MTTRPNKSPEPTAVGAVSSAVAVPVASRRWLSLLRSFPPLLERGIRLAAKHKPAVKVKGS